ncbi:MAG: hypothetical protein JWO71_3314 [Candidatus Acidoferrum typicum]|nr:hypothetical protein [Candidatus Acidoferrum typicum]
MGETPDQIERHIHEKRNELGENINELQQKVKTAVDWRAQFDQRPLVMVGIAFGGGLLLSMLIGRRNSDRASSRSSRDRWRRESQDYDYSSRPERHQPEEKRSTAWANIRDAVIAVAASKLSGLIEKVVPGFSEQYKRRQTERRSPSPHNGPESVWRRRTASGETDYSPQS